MNLPDFLALDEYGYIFLAGHRIGLRHVVEMYQDAATPEMIQAHFPTLSLALVHKVIAFYLENRAEVEAYVQESRDAVDRLATAPQSGPDAAELRRRMESRRPRSGSFALGGGGSAYPCHL